MYYAYMYLATPMYEQDMTQGQFFKAEFNILNFSQTGCYTKVKEPKLPHYLGIPFTRVLALCEMSTHMHYLHMCLH